MSFPGYCVGAEKKKELGTHCLHMLKISEISIKICSITLELQRIRLWWPYVVVTFLTCFVLQSL